MEMENVSDLKMEGGFISVAYDPPSEPDFTSYKRGIEIFESWMSIMNENMQALTALSISMVGVYGLGRVGKTTLMYQVAEKAKLDKSFDAVVTASVTFRSIQSQMANQLHLELGKETSFGRASHLKEWIRKEKIILIILYDI
ncbi:hypothetical protein L6164_002689 [Bauhinia variegata]|uniref:Uncharacterized protein n=1 Tax=Bauhinia variegata TaxID=167791 RepID=A0ACB9Q1N1_BAUVA|nr:hypothetical protein L6164_002689 [Bauhinia variegata]